MQFIILLYPFILAKKTLKSIRNYLILTFLIFMTPGCITNSAEKDALALAVIGDRYHNSDYIRTALRKTLAEKAGIAIDFTDDVNQISRSNLRNYRMLILFKDGMIWPEGYSKINPIRIISNPPLEEEPEIMEYWMTDKQATAIKDFIEDGLTYKELGPTCEAGWAFKMGKGRVCYLAPGHMITALWNTEYQKIQINTVKWLLREL